MHARAYGAERLVGAHETCCASSLTHTACTTPIPTCAPTLVIKVHHNIRRFAIDCARTVFWATLCILHRAAHDGGNQCGFSSEVSRI